MTARRPMTPTERRVLATLLTMALPPGFDRTFVDRLASILPDPDATLDEAQRQALARCGRRWGVLPPL